MHGAFVEYTAPRLHYIKGAAVKRVPLTKGRRQLTAHLWKYGAHTPSNDWQPRQHPLVQRCAIRRGAPESHCIGDFRQHSRLHQGDEALLWVNALNPLQQPSTCPSVGRIFGHPVVHQVAAQGGEAQLLKHQAQAFVGYGCRGLATALGPFVRRAALRYLLSYLLLEGGNARHPFHIQLHQQSWLLCWAPLHQRLLQERLCHGRKHVHKSQ
mmetsp:Transcript_2296/g.4117  ORF Transcript_2296/g.4117 Transcript_2296/m.4117 type:complete len:211 (+) Transcript_2296:899-1531(+)